MCILLYEQAVLVRVFGLKLAVLAEHSSPRAQTFAKNQEEGLVTLPGVLNQQS